MPKHIIINGRFLTQRITGVQRYAREICLELDKIIKHNEITIAVPPEATDIPDYKNINVVRVGKFHNRLWEQISFPLYVSKMNAISLNLCNASPLINPGIVCIFDMKIKAVPQFFSKKFLVWYSLLFFNAFKRAEKIITISRFSKEEILKYYKIPSEKIVIIPCAWQHFNRIAFKENTLAKYSLKKNTYNFALSSLEPNKNFKWIAESALSNPDDLYVVAGSINQKVFANGLGFDCPNNMKLIGYVTDEEAKTLMRDCKAFLFPSIYEGFGIPPLEAMSAGAKRIIVSDIPVMHEIFGDSVDYIGKEYSIPREIRNDNKLESFSWEKSSKILFDVLKKIRS